MSSKRPFQIYLLFLPNSISVYKLQILSFKINNFSFSIFQKTIKEHLMAHSWLSATIAILLLSSVFRTKAQISTPCTSSMISSFTPCLNFVTGSSGTGSSPTEDCCNSLKSLMTDNMDCACLIVTGNVPVSIPFINANLAISLPRVCKSSVPLQCKCMFHIVRFQ